MARWRAHVRRLALSIHCSPVESPSLAALSTHDHAQASLPLQRVCDWLALPDRFIESCLKNWICEPNVHHEEVAERIELENLQYLKYLMVYLYTVAKCMCNSCFLWRKRKWFCVTCITSCSSRKFQAHRLEETPALWNVKRLQRYRQFPVQQQTGRVMRWWCSRFAALWMVCDCELVVG